ncbi:MAG: PAS-domain containing protein [Rhodocyclaceae bacterium]|nr:PAS-domain containing protein [Rhodocyclaceae bacterium]
MAKRPQIPSPPAAPSGSAEELRRYDLLLAGLDLLDQGLAVFDSAPRLVAWNKAFLRLLEFPENMVRVGTPFEDFVRYNAERGEYGDGESDSQVAARMSAVRAFQPHYTERIRPNGDVLAIHGVPIPNLGFVSLWTDITEQRRYEALIQQQNADLELRVKARTRELEDANSRLAHANEEIDEIAGALRRSESRLRLIMDSIPALIAYVDADQHYQFANKGYADWFGLRAEQMVGRSIADVFGPETYVEIREHLAKAYQGDAVSYEYSRRTNDRRTVHARSVVVPEMGSDGRVLGFFVLSIDITEQKASQAALIQAQKMEAVGQLTGGLAHDFNNLLTIIIGNLNGLKDQLPDNPLRAGEYVEPALHAARRGAELIKRLLTFSRRQTLEPSAVEIGALVQNMAQLLSRSLTESIELATDIPTARLYALVDPHQLENALLNLAINARDAMPQGGTLRIAVSERHIGGTLAQLTEIAVGDYVQIDVSDDGCGIDPALLPRVFEPFVTTKAFGAGSGLGLSMVYGFVRQSGGNIRILSTPGKGTHVRFVLPRTEAPAPTVPAPTRGALRATGGKLVLLVEDEPEIRRIVRLQLGELGYPVIEASNGVEAGEMLANVPDIGLMISDMVMPGGIGGAELLALARRQRPELPVLLVTGYAGDTGPLPDAPMLRKPFDKGGLAAALEQLEQSTEASTP